MNKVLLTGRLTKEIELQQYNNGQNMNCRFTLAVDRGTKDAQGNKQSDFISCVAFNQSADFLAKYCHKGDKIGIEGRIQTGQYQAQDGNTKYTTDVIVDRLEIESQVQQQPQQQGYQGYQQPQSQQQFNPAYNNQYNQGYPQQQGYTPDNDKLPF